MPRTRARVLTASALAAAVLAGASACTALTDGAAQPVRGASPAAKSSPTAPAPGALTEAQAQAALVTAADLGEPWAPTQGAATWRDGVLKATTDAPDCRRLLDALYTDDLFGTDARIRAVVGLDDAVDQAQLRYQVLTLDAGEVSRTLDWMRGLPRTCGRFTAVTQYGAVQGVQVTQARLPEVGDARQGLRVTLTGATADGEPTVLTLDVAAVRSGEDTIAVSDGGLADVSPDVTATAVQKGLQRLADVRKQGRAQV
ncbi:hypothetical protein [Streptomyces gilvus]|uniref:hypothetical protein n=1 Tax=Streptomyces gilvus TaxID=2920937 RepID=UPI001F0E8898|nr:hypothetical protein [Streptomyces sp. CME 23]MCH5672492.1 hypothetical protein [Streptomyces sp. CME 23]